MSPSFYLNRLAKPSVSIPIFTTPPVGGVALRRQNVASVEVRPDDAGPWRVTLLPLQYQEQPGGQIVNFTFPFSTKPRAVLTWGHDAVVFTTRIDWPVTGGSFNVWGDKVSIDLEIPDDWIAGLVPAAIVGGGFILPGNVAGGMRPTLTVWGGRTQGAGTFSAPIEIPQFARSVRWHQGFFLGGFGPAVPIRWGGAMDSGIAVPTFSTNPGVFDSSERSWPGPDGLTWPCDTRFLLWNNDTPLLADDLSLNLEFVLDLG